MRFLISMDNGTEDELGVILVSVHVMQSSKTLHFYVNYLLLAGRFLLYPHLFFTTLDLIWRILHTITYMYNPPQHMWTGVNAQ
ncbi:hypothetical protein ACJX0J_027270, partial [Zea mays]